MSDLMLFPSAVGRDPAVDGWFDLSGDPMRELARPWFERMRVAGPGVRELMHDGHPTACLEEAAFAYVAAFSAHVNVGFFQGASLPDPAGLLQGTGKRMRHVKVRWGEPIDEAALGRLIEDAWRDMRRRLDEGD